MKRVTLELDSEGFRELLTSQEVADLVEESAKQVAAAAEAVSIPGSVFVVKGPKRGGYGGGRVIAYGAAENQAAYREAVYAHTLEKAVWEAQA
jgi:hypothetical protein